MSHPTLRSALARPLALALAFLGVLALNQSLASPAAAAGNAISSTTNVAAGTGACQAPSRATTDPDPINCNAYGAKADVWLSNLPQALGDGQYFLAVVSPGGQPDVNDGSSKLLSTDSHLDRAFQVSGGTVTSLGTHVVVDNKVQVLPFADTPNPGGVYVLAVCPLASYPVAAHDCKFDSFKVGPGTPDAADPLTVTKDATGGYDRTYAWNIVKSADKTKVYQSGGSVTANYTVKVSHDPGTVSDVSVTGTIDVFNPNEAAVTGVVVTDTLSDGTACAVAGGSNATVAPGDNQFDYTCALDGLPDGQLDNTVTATWADQTVGGKALAGGNADFTFSGVQFAANPVDACVNVTDTVQGTLGTVCVTDANPASFTYARALTVQPGCVAYPNTASYTTNDSASSGSSSATVTICGPLKTGALTIGFWQNKNGQGVITGGASTAGVCNVGTWLRQYQPFQDLSATANCAAVASYATKVIKAASAAGSAMNAMLKAQMLATAFDVYYTGPGSTTATQKFLPHSNLGGITIDLLHPEVVSGAFGGATSMTVSQLLAYAAGQSNAGGSNWYGNVKSVQGLAKDIFDIINNQGAFGA